MKRYLHIFFTFFRTSWLIFLAHRFNFVMSSLANIMWTFSQVITLHFLSQKIHALAGWGFPELVLLMALTQVYYYTAFILYEQSLSKLFDKVRDGTFDRMLTKPINIKFLASFETIGVAQIFSVFVGCVPLLIIGLSGSRNLNPALFLPAIVVLTFGLLTMYFLSLSISGFTFFLEDVQSFKDFVVYSSGDFARLPIDIFPTFLRFTLSFIIPLAFTTYYPVIILKGASPTLLIIGGGALTLIFYLISKLTWSLGLKRYSGVG